MTRPNLVFVMADQLRRASCGYAGDRLAHTPNIDRLARESVDFRQCVSSMPVCSAFRASLFTGKYTTSTGMVINELRMNPNHRCLGHVLTDGGYDTSYIGKWHLWANQLGNHADPRNSFVPRGPHRLGFDGYWAAYNFRHEYYAPAAYYHTESPEKITYPASVYEPDAQTDLAIERLRAHRAADKPFAMVLSYGTPHDPWTRNNVPAEWLKRFADVDFPPAETYRDEPDTPYGDAWSNEPKTAAKVREWKRVYYAMTANLDWNLGRLDAALGELGLRDNTIMVFTSDHGEMFGAHGRMKKNIFYEEAARIPFLLRWPARAASRVVDTCFSNVDMMPTLLGLAGLPVPAAVEGMDLSHVALGQPGPEPEVAFLQNTGACASWEDGHEWRAVRDRRYTYAIYRVDRSELLFDNVADPTQSHNLASDPAHQATLERLRAQLAGQMARVQDTFPASSWYREHWISGDRLILRTATLAD
ncbi:MAG: sulfatase [Armatimonadetes bacterium]|nr:sulfatase [Armatimonadota bacterium]